MAGRWIRPTRGTLAAITALVKNKPGRLLASIRDAAVGNRRLWVEQVDGSLRGLAWLDEVSSGGGGGGSLVTAPTISGSTSAAAGSSVTLTASASVSAFADTGTTIAKYTWTKPDATTVDGATLAVTASATVGGTVTVKCRATDTIGNVSADKTFTLTTAANQAPSATGVTINLPATITRGSTYAVTISNGTDADGTIATRTLINPHGCTLSGSSGSTVNLTVNNDATSVSVTPVVTDNNGLSSTNGVAITRSGASIVQPAGTSGLKSTGTHTVTVPAGVSSITIAGNGGAGMAAVPASAVTVNAAKYTFPTVININSGTISLSVGFYVCCSTSLITVSYEINLAANTCNIAGIAGTMIINDGSTKRWRANVNFGDSNGRTYRRVVNVNGGDVQVWNENADDAGVVGVVGFKRSTYGYGTPGGADYIITSTTSQLSSPGTAGAATTVSGAASHTFAGAATGVATTPAATSVVKALNPATANTLTLVVGSGGSCRVDW